MSEGWKEWVEVASLDAPTAERAILKFTPPAVDAFNRGRGIFATAQLLGILPGQFPLAACAGRFSRKRPRRVLLRKALPSKTAEVTVIKDYRSDGCL